VRIVKTFQRAPAHVSRANTYVRALREAVSNSLEGEALSVGRDGASDAISFLEAGVPAVEFGPVGGGHHGPEEWVSVQSLARYRRALGDFVVGLPAWLARESDKPSLRAVEGGLA
jgi:succinyl-diaminopimelate desuccinylase